MHITIYGIAESTDNIDKIAADMLDDDSYAIGHYDYWQDISTSDEELAQEISDWLTGGRAVVDQDENGWYVQLDQESIDDYFHRMWQQFKEALVWVNTATEKHMKAWDVPGLYRLRMTHDDTCGSMFFSWDEGWLTPQDFMRAAEPGKKYYICGAVDAHL